jgi:hypothetical protein
MKQESTQMSHVLSIQSAVGPLTFSSNSSLSAFAGIGILYPLAASPLLDMGESDNFDKFITDSLFVWLSLPKFSLSAANLNPVTCIWVRNARYWTSKVLTVLRYNDTKVQEASIRFVMSVRPYLYTEEIGSYWLGLRGI